MTIKLKLSVRTARIGQVESTINTEEGGAPYLCFYTGAPPTNITDANSGVFVGSFQLPTDWLTAASNGAVGKNGTWSGALATGGDIGHFRIQNSARNTTYMQGTAGTSGADMIIDNDVMTAGQVLTVTACDLTDGNA